MEKTELAKYELIIIVDSKATGDEKESIHKEVAETINKAGGKVINGQVWLDKHKFTFPIAKRNEGTYYLINFENNGGAIEKVNSALRVNERVLRYLISRAETPLVAKAAVAH